MESLTVCQLLELQVLCCVANQGCPGVHRHGNLPDLPLCHHFANSGPIAINTDLVFGSMADESPSPNHSETSIPSLKSVRGSPGEKYKYEQVLY